jgi:hypothetical protein
VTELLVPYGINREGLLVAAADARKGDSYACPQCAAQLLLRAGEVVKRHFAHRMDSMCTAESIAHIIAKRLVVQVIEECSAIDAKRQLTLTSECRCCGDRFPVELPSSALTSAVLEQQVGPYVCDVVASRTGQQVLAIEILATHPVNESKAVALSLPWIELRADSVLRDPYCWQPVATRGLKALVCPACKARVAEVKVVVRKWGLGFEEPALFRDASRAKFLAEVTTCWSCQEEIPVYWWAGVPFCDTEPPMPRPRTVKFRKSKAYGGSYWANTCPGCNHVQGDNYVFLDAEAVINGLPLRQTEETKGAFSNSATAIAERLLRHF